MFDSPLWLTLQWWGKLIVELVLLGIALGVSYLVGAFVVNFIRRTIQVRRKNQPVRAEPASGTPTAGTPTFEPVDPATSGPLAFDLAAVALGRPTCSVAPRVRSSATRRR